MKLHLHAPRFVCEYEAQYEEGGAFRKMVELSHPTQLEQLSLVSGITVVEVQVVLPIIYDESGHVGHASTCFNLGG